MKSSSILFIISLILSGCQHVVVDPSIESVYAEDFTAPMSACEGTPTVGMDVCIVKENSIINSNWILIAPLTGNSVTGVDVSIYYKDISKQYAMDSNMLVIPWADIVGGTKWERSMDGEALALVLVKYIDPQGINKIAKFRGIAKLVVVREGYDRLPIGSSFTSWKTKCTMGYSTSGRTSIQCK